MFAYPWAITLLLGAALLIALSGQAEPADAPSDLLDKARLIGIEIEFIRLEAGRPVVAREAPSVRNASWHQLRSQASNLLQRAERLSFEWTHERHDPPPSPAGAAGAEDVRALLDGTLAALRQVKQSLGIPEAASTTSGEGGGDRDHLLRSLVELNQRLDPLLVEHFGPAETYQELTQAAAYSSALLSVFPGAVRLPDPPERVRGQTPEAVYVRLLALSNRVARVMEHSGLPRTQIAALGDAATPRDPQGVHLLASLIRSDLEFLHASLPGASPVPSIRFPGQKLPSDCHQRAGLVERQLEQLEQLVKREPAWLRKAGPK